jgi:hypothetical protein
MTTPGPLPTTPEPPSARKLFRSTAIAAAIATAILVTIVLPAEYGVDPTGIGSVLGLKEMGEIKMRLANEEAAHAAEDGGAETPLTAVAPVTPAPAPAATPAAPAEKADTVQVVLLPGEGKEIKLVMQEDATVTYSWSTNKGTLNFDKHADSPTIKYHGYGKGTSVAADSGSLKAAFEGHHGWFWRNRTTDTVTVTLRTTGQYQDLLRLP